MAVDSSMHCDTGNGGVVGFFGLDSKSDGVAVDLVVGLGRLLLVR